MSRPDFVRFTSEVSAIRLYKFQNDHICVTAGVADRREVQIARFTATGVVGYARKVNVVVVAV